MKFPSPSIKHTPGASKDLLFRRRQRAEPDKDGHDGTVLRAVPPFGGIKMSPHRAKAKERRASGPRSATPVVLASAFSSSDWNQSRTPSVTSAHSIEGWSEVHADFLGVWKDGTVHWAPGMSDDDGAPDEADKSDDEDEDEAGAGEEGGAKNRTSLLSEYEPHPGTRVNIPTSLSARPRRPKIQVTIPTNRSSTTTVTKGPDPSRPTDLVTPAAEAESTASSRITSTYSEQVSSLSSGHSTIRQSTAHRYAQDLPLRDSIASMSTVTPPDSGVDLPIQLGAGLSASSLSTSSDDHLDDDASSVYSGRSSVSSATLDVVYKPGQSRRASVAYSILSPVVAGVYDEQAPAARNLRSKTSAISLASLANKPLPPAPLDMAPAPLNIAPRQRSKADLLKTASPRSTRSNSPLHVPDSPAPSPFRPSTRTASRPGLKSKYSASDLDALDQAFVRAGPPPDMSALVEVEEALAMHLDTIAEQPPESPVQPVQPEAARQETQEPIQVSRGPMVMSPSRAAPVPPTPTLEQPVRATRDGGRSGKGHGSPRGLVAQQQAQAQAQAQASSPVIPPRRDSYRAKWTLRAQQSLLRARNGKELRVSLIDPPDTALRSLPNTPVSAAAPSGAAILAEPAVWEITKRLELVKMKERSEAIRSEAFRLADTKGASELASLSAGGDRPKYSRYRAPSVVLPARRPSQRHSGQNGGGGRVGVPSMVSASVSDTAELPAEVPRPGSARAAEASTAAAKETPAPVELDAGIPPHAAEQVLLTILRSLTSLQDLFSTAVVSKGFYQTFKKHELPLMRNALKAMSPAAWELRESSPPTAEKEDGRIDHSARVHTPRSYLQSYTRDLYIMVALKSLILVRCESFLRPETVAALSGHDDQRSLQLDEAFWRVWTFCKLFGSNKDREDDAIGQMDWLRGGLIAHQDLSSSSLAMTDPAIGMSSALLNPPDSFGRGNRGGLSPAQLWDMTEIWTCLGVLMHGFHGQRELARSHGIFEGQEVGEGEVEKEDGLIEEWASFILTLGPSVVLDLATRSEKDASQGFALAVQKGWTRWDGPRGGRRRATFLKDAVTRVYEEKMAALRIPERSHSRKLSINTAQVSGAQSPGRAEQKSSERQRRLAYAADVRALRESPDFHEVPVAEERPMSTWSEVFRKLDPTPTTTTTPSLPMLPSTSAPAEAPTVSPPQVDDPVDKAVGRMVGMGFSAELAKKALAETDTGENINVQAAIELCARWTTQHPVRGGSSPKPEGPAVTEAKA